MKWVTIRIPHQPVFAKNCLLAAFALALVAAPKAFELIDLFWWLRK